MDVAVSSGLFKYQTSYSFYETIPDPFRLLCLQESLIYPSWRLEPIHPMHLGLPRVYPKTEYELAYACISMSSSNSVLLD